MSHRMPPPPAPRQLAHPRQVAVNRGVAAQAPRLDILAGQAGLMKIRNDFINDIQGLGAPEDVTEIMGQDAILKREVKKLYAASRALARKCHFWGVQDLPDPDVETEEVIVLAAAGLPLPDRGRTPPHDRDPRNGSSGAGQSNQGPAQPPTPLRPQNDPPTPPPPGPSGLQDQSRQRWMAVTALSAPDESQDAQTNAPNLNRPETRSMSSTEPAPAALPVPMPARSRGQRVSKLNLLRQQRQQAATGPMTRSRSSSQTLRGDSPAQNTRSAHSPRSMGLGASIEL